MYIIYVIYLAIISKSFQGRLLIETFTTIKNDKQKVNNENIVEIEGVLYTYDVRKVNF